MGRQIDTDKHRLDNEFVRFVICANLRSSVARNRVEKQRIGCQ